MPLENRPYTLAEVIAGGFEAECIAVDGCWYLWHGNRGIRIDDRHGIRSLVTQPSLLPDGDWFPTELGEREIAEAAHLATGNHAE
jgi:hypothetical protein